MKPDVFDFIEKHNLHDAIREKVCFSTIFCKNVAYHRHAKLLFPECFCFWLLKVATSCKNREKGKTTLLFHYPKFSHYDYCLHLG